jgi:hypothetical protein
MFQKCLLPQDNALMVEEVSTSEMLDNFYQTTWCNIVLGMRNEISQTILKLTKSIKIDCSLLSKFGMHHSTIESFLYIPWAICERGDPGDDSYTQVPRVWYSVV